MQALPDCATDTHVTLANADAALAAYRAGMARLGLSRCVLVQASAAIDDQAGMLAALAALGPAGRGVAIVPADLAGPELDLLGAQGVCGLRCRLPDPGGLMSWEGAARLAARAAERGWHLELAFDPADWPRCEALIGALPATIVLTRRAFAGPDRPEAGVLRRLLEAGNVWIKLPADAARARALIREAADRCLWGSGWPCEDGLESRLAPLAGLGEATRARILVANPATVYGFG
jgi:predicted TIM-barrel fold metal-dependent hydrolase